MTNEVWLAPEAQKELDALPRTVYARVLDVIERLQAWPAVSGAKPLTREWKGHYRIRTGDWRVIFQVVAPGVLVVRIAHRSKVYEE